MPASMIWARERPTQARAIEGDGAGVRLQTAADQIEERALAGAVRADDRGERAGREGDRDVGDGRDAAEGFMQTLDLEHGVSSRFCWPLRDAGGTSRR